VIEYLLKGSQGSGRKGRYRRKPCTVLVQGKHWQDKASVKGLANFPKGAAGTGKG